MEGGKDVDTQQVDLGATLGVDADISTQCFTIYVPNKDRTGQEDRQSAKVGSRSDSVALRDQRRSHGHAARGRRMAERSPGNHLEIIWENPVVVYSFLRPSFFQGNLPRIREFLHRLGRETN